MLRDEPRVLVPDPILSVIGLVNGNDTTRKIQTGVYQITHFGSTDFLRDYEQWPGYLSINSYGVCDSVEQVLDQCPELQSPDRTFVVTVTPVVKANQSPEGGWRWHKWGPYIGTRKITSEYLYDEPDIEQVLVYQIYESRTADAPEATH